MFSGFGGLFAGLRGPCDSFRSDSLFQSLLVLRILAPFGGFGGLFAGFIDLFHFFSRY